jgi:aquaporin Z
MFAALMYIGFHVSGAHYNPAISVAAFINNDIKRDEFLKYIAAQVAGAFLGTHMAMMYFGGGVHMFGVSSELGLGIQVMMEALLTGLFCWAVLTATMTAALRNAAVYGIIAAFTLVAVGSIGGLCNPAVAMGGMLMGLAQGAGCMCREAMLVYLIAPFAGAILAAYAYPYFSKK